MSYAAAAAKGPKQSPEEKRAPVPPEVEHTDISSTSSLIDVDTPSIHTVSSEFSSQPIQTETQQFNHEYEETRAKAESELHELHLKEIKAKEKAKKEAKKGKKWLGQNEDNPVVVGNAIAVVGLSAALGFGAYRKYAAGELSWKVVGAWTGVVGLFVAADYYLSSYLFKNKYPPKK